MAQLDCLCSSAAKSLIVYNLIKVANTQKAELWAFRLRCFSEIITQSQRRQRTCVSDTAHSLHLPLPLTGLTLSSQGLSKELLDLPIRVDKATNSVASVKKKHQVCQSANWSIDQSGAITYIAILSPSILLWKLVMLSHIITIHKSRWADCVLSRNCWSTEAYSARCSDQFQSDLGPFLHVIPSLFLSRQTDCGLSPESGHSKEDGEKRMINIRNILCWHYEFCTCTLHNSYIFSNHFFTNHKKPICWHLCHWWILVENILTHQVSGWCLISVFHVFISSTRNTKVALCGVFVKNWSSEQGSRPESSHISGQPDAHDWVIQLHYWSVKCWSFSALGIVLGIAKVEPLSHDEVIYL